METCVKGWGEEEEKEESTLLTVNEIEGEEKARTHEGDVKSLRQAKRKSGRRMGKK